MNTQTQMTPAKNVDLLPPSYEADLVRRAVGLATPFTIDAVKDEFKRLVESEMEEGYPTTPSPREEELMAHWLLVEEGLSVLRRYGLDDIADALRVHCVDDRGLIEPR